MSLDLNCEQNRLNTFTSWFQPHISAQKLAKTGFYFVGFYEPDHVKCNFCKVEIIRFAEDDDEVTEHIRWSKNCPLLRRRDTDNMPIDAEELNLLLPPLTYAVTGTLEIGAETQPSNHFPLNLCIHPEYVREASRQRTFKSWPPQIKQKAWAMSRAGFFYTTKADFVKCISCGIGLRDWEKMECPWAQHEKWSPHCLFLKFKRDERNAQIALDKKNDPQHLSSDDMSDDDESAKKSGSSKTCVVCLHNEYNTVFFPCSHVSSCLRCASSINKCPICRCAIKVKKHVYFA